MPYLWMDPTLGNKTLEVERSLPKSWLEETMSDEGIEAMLELYSKSKWEGV